LFYFKRESALRGGIGWTAEDTNIESAGVLDPDPDPPIIVTSAGALDHPDPPIIVTSAGALDLITAIGTLIPLTPAVIDIDK
jgi:hypothetical protein